MPKIKVSELLAGMVLSKPIISPKTGKLLLKDGAKIDEKMVDYLRKHNVKKVDIIERYTLFVDAEMTTYNELEKMMIEDIKRLAPEKAEVNTSDEMAEVSRQACEIVKDILDDKEIIEFCVRMKLLDNEYFFKHSAYTCVLSLLTSGIMGFDYTMMKKIGKAALLHDLGLGEMPFLIKLEDPENLNALNNELFKEHPVYGYYIAKEKNIDRDVCRYIAAHHERWDGNGFPKGLSQEEIAIGARIIAVCDKYDTLIRHNNYPPYEAIEYLYGGGNVMFDPEVVEAFTENLAVYPLGTLVRLSNGEVGTVVNIRKNKGPRPIVRVYHNDVNRKLREPKNIDLAEEKTVFIDEVF